MIDPAALARAKRDIAQKVRGAFEGVADVSFGMSYSMGIPENVLVAFVRGRRGRLV